MAIGGAAWRRILGVVAPWLRFAAWCYLTRDRDVQPVAGEQCVPAVVEPADLLAAEPFDGGWCSYDRAPESTAQDVFGTIGFDWFQMPHRDPDSHVPAEVLPELPEVDLFGGPPSPAEISEAARYVVVVANRIAREAAQGGAK